MAAAAAANTDQETQLANLPLLLHSNPYISSKDTCIRAVLNLSTFTIKHTNLYEIPNNTICGTSSGWLITINDVTSSVTLVNPITTTKIQLPPILMPENQNGVLVHKAILSSDPNTNPNGFIVLAICGDSRNLVYIKFGDDSWTMVDESERFYDDINSDDGGELFAVNELGRVVYLNFRDDVGDSDSDRPPRLLIVELTTAWLFRGDKLYMLIIDGYLYLVLRFLNKDDDEGGNNLTRGFEIFKYFPQFQKWFEVQELNDGCVFLGSSHSMALPRSLSNNFTANNIFFTDDRVENKKKNGDKFGRDVGQCFYKFDQREVTHQTVINSAHPPEIWFMPNYYV